MDTEKSSGDYIIDELALLGSGKKQKKTNTISNKTTPKDLILNGLSAVAVMAVVMLCNLLITPEFHYERIYSWNFGLLIVVNWVCGIMVTYFLRQSGINTAKLTEAYVSSEKAKQEAFAKIEDYHAAQVRLDKLIEEDFDARRRNLEDAIAKLVRPKLPGGVDWHIGDPLPKGTHVRIRKMKKRLDRMTPPQISIVALAQSEASYSLNSLYDVRPSPERTGTLWFVRKGGGKIGWFAVAPIVLSLLANGLMGGVTIANIVSTVGIIGVMIFNAAREYTLSYASVARFGVDRNRQIVQIINEVTKSAQKN